MKGDIYKNKMQALLEMRADFEKDVKRDGASEWE